MVTIGADPEFFLRDKATLAPVSSVGLVGGSKKNPVRIPGIGHRGYTMQEDNVMVEFNIPPTSDYGQFSDRIERAFESLALYVQREHEGLEPMLGECSILFPHSALDSEGAQTFGCSRDFNAHENGVAIPAFDKREFRAKGGEWRFAGGHVHIGYKSKAPDFVAASFADVFLGLPSVALDKQGERRKYYGSAGRYRPTEYGIEYRVLSNFWMWDRNLSFGVGAQASRLGQFLQQGEDVISKKYSSIPWNDVQRAINEEDDDLAADLIVYLTKEEGLSL